MAVGESEFLHYFAWLASRLEPSLLTAYLASMRDLADVLTLTALVEQLRAGNVDQLVAALLDDRTMAVALAAVQQAIHTVASRAAQQFYRDIPTAARAGAPAAGGSPVSPIARVRMNVLDPAVVRAIQAYDSEALRAMATNVRTVVKQVAETGLRAGVNPRDIAKDIKETLGLSPTQEVYVRNYRDELTRLDPAALERVLTNGTFDRTVAVAIRDAKPLTPAQIDRGVALYRENWKQSHAETVSRTVTLNSMRESQRIAWDQAITAGKVNASDLIEIWVTTLDGRERPAHHLMDGTEKGYHDLWYVPGVGPQRYPGESEYNCRCRTWIRPRIRRASER